MSLNTLSSPARFTVAMVLGLALLLTSFYACLGLLYRTGRLDYERGVVALWFSGVIAMALFFTIGFSRAGRYVVGEDREHLMKTLAWASLVLPLEAFVEPFVVEWLSRNSGATWLYLRYPIQFAVGGLLGVAAGMSKRKWGWTVWGTTAALYGMFWTLGLVMPGK